MSVSSAIAIDIAKTGHEGSFGNRRRALRLNAQVMQKSRDCWPVKTALHLSEITGYSVRACEGWLGGNVVLPTDALAALMQSEQGREFLACVMTDYTPRWWTVLQSFFRRITAEENRARAEREYMEMLNEQQTDAREGPRSAWISDPVFHAGLAQLRSPMASKKRNGR
jgi:hypothetical protein